MSIDRPLPPVTDVMLQKVDDSRPQPSLIFKSRPFSPVPTGIRLCHAGPLSLLTLLAIGHAELRAPKLTARAYLHSGPEKSIVEPRGYINGHELNIPGQYGTLRDNHWEEGTVPQQLLDASAS